MRVVAIPSWELFSQQSKEYKEKVLPSSNSKRIALEMDISLKWERFVGFKGIMDSSGEETALDLQTATPVIPMSLLMRYRSLDNDTFTGKVVAALRNEFGGHAVVKN